MSDSAPNGKWITTRFLPCRSQQIPMTNNNNPKTLTPFQLTLTVDNFIPPGGIDKADYMVCLSEPVSFHFLEWDLRVLVDGPDRKKLGLVLLCRNPCKKNTGWKCTVDFTVRLWKEEMQGEVVVDKDNCVGERKDVTYSSKMSGSPGFVMNLSELLKLNGTKYVLRNNSIVLTVDVCPKEIMGLHYEEKSRLIHEWKGDNKKSMLHLLVNGIGSDVTFKTKDGAEIKAHKAILMDRSPVFKAMFESGLSESKSGEIEVNDIDGDTITKLLKVLYSGDPASIDLMSKKSLRKLLYAAEKYDLDWIKNYTGYILSETCGLEGAPYLHKLAKRYRLDQVKEEVTQLAKTNFSEVWDLMTDQLATDSE